MMGSGFVEALLRRGERVAVWNRTPEKTRLLEALGATGFADPSEAARGADRIHIMLSDDAAVDALLDRIASAIVIDHTTVAPRPTAARFERCERESIAFLHAPVFMSPQMTREGKGIMLCSGPAERFERARSFLAAMTADLWYVGERTDKAAALKLFGNQMIFFITAGLADGFALTRSVDLPPRHDRLSREEDRRGRFQLVVRPYDGPQRRTFDARNGAGRRRRAARSAGDCEMDGRDDRARLRRP